MSTDPEYQKAADALKHLLRQTKAGYRIVHPYRRVPIQNFQPINPYQSATEAAMRAERRKEYAEIMMEPSASSGEKDSLPLYVSIRPGEERVLDTKFVDTVNVTGLPALERKPKDGVIGPWGKAAANVLALLFFTCVIIALLGAIVFVGKLVWGML